MLRRVSHILLSLWLAMVLFFGSTPKEFIHLFADHVDTVHSVHQHDGLVIEPEHHHCTFLNYALPLFLNDDHKIQLCFREPVVYVEHASKPVIQFIAKASATAYLRGPPIA